MAKNKWLIALSGMLLQFSIGSIYAYSIWINPIFTSNGWTAQELKPSFSLALCFLGLTAAFMGKTVQKIGPRKSGLLASLFFAAGLACSGLAVQIDSLLLFYLSYGVISGIGLGIGYITPVSVVVKWFPEKPGFASGLVIMSFAAGSVAASQLIPSLTQAFSVSTSFYLLAGTYCLLMILASLYIALPPLGKNSETDTEKKSVRISVLLKDKRFYTLWLMLFFNTVCGIALISVAAPLAKDVIKIDEKSAIVFVGIIGLFNGLGRIFWSGLSDKIGRWNTFMCFYIVGIACFLVLSQTPQAFVFQAAIYVIISCYGGAFATMPAFIKDIYGQENLNSVFGYILIAWSIAAFAGPGIISLSLPHQTVFLIFVVLLAVPALMMLFLKKSLSPSKDSAS